MVLKKAGIKPSFKSGRKLKDALCSKNKSKIDQREKKGIYCLKCPCTPSAKYVGMTARKIATRTNEHKKAVENKKWSHSGITAHKENCPLPVDWDNPQILDTMNAKNKKSLNFNLRLRESIHIAKENTGPGYGLNEDWGGYLKSRIWLPVFRTMQ